MQNQCSWEQGYELLCIPHMQAALLHCLRLVPNSAILKVMTTSSQNHQAEKFEVCLGKSSKEAELVKDGAEILIC